MVDAKSMNYAHATRRAEAVGQVAQWQSHVTGKEADSALHLVAEHLLQLVEEYILVSVEALALRLQLRLVRKSDLGG